MEVHMRNGRLFRMSHELFFVSLACLAVTILLPLSVWQTLGESGASLTILASAGLITSAIVLRQRPALRRDLPKPAPAESAG
jgi:hypothetical protein